MTWAQWLFEYYAISSKEREQAELWQAILKNVEHTLIALLGLNLVPKKQGDDQPGFVPLSFLCGRPEMLKHYLENVEREVMPGKDPDDVFEEFSSELLKQLQTGHSNLPPDILKVVMGDLSESDRRASFLERQQELASLGVLPRLDSTAVPHIGPPKVQIDPYEEELNLRPANWKPVREEELDKFRKALAD